MTALADWQRALSGIIDAEQPDFEGLACLQPVPGPSAEQGFSVYRNNSRGARSNALADVYPVCRRLIGEQSFAGLTRRFVQLATSEQGDLNLFGVGFSEFVAETVAEHEIFARLSWLGDLVHLEWLCHSVYYADDDPPLDLGPLQLADPSPVCPRPAKRLAWMQSPWPVHRVWQAHQDADEPPAIPMHRGDWHLVVERREFRPRIEVIDRPLWDLLDACGRSMSLAELGADTNLDTGRLGELVQRQWIGVLEHPGDAV